MYENKKINIPVEPQKNHTEKKLSIQQKIFAGIFLTAILLIGVSFGILTVRDMRRLDIAYYGLPKSVTEALSAVLQSIDTDKYYPNGIRETVLMDSDMKNENRISRKYDMLFMWNGAQAMHLADKAQKNSINVYDALPSAIQQAGKSGKLFPILLDHYELACLQETPWQNISKDFEAFQAYLKALKNEVAFPLFCAGSDDETLLAFVGALVESQAGHSGYTTLIAEINNEHSFDDCLDAVLAAINNQKVTLRSVLDVIVSWQKNGIIHQSWTDAVWDDTLAFMNDKSAGVVFMSLTQHRTVPYRTIQNYEAIYFPVNSNIKDHALIAPAVSLLYFSSDANFRNNVTLSLASEQMQEYLSDLTQLAPTASRGGAADRQADDVRYWAASCAGGPVAALGKAAFISLERQTAFAMELRNYLRMQ